MTKQYIPLCPWCLPSTRGQFVHDAEYRPTLEGEVCAWADLHWHDQGEGWLTFTCPKCGSRRFGTVNPTSDYSEWVGRCGNLHCGFHWLREKEDPRYFHREPSAVSPSEHEAAVRSAYEAGFAAGVRSATEAKS